MRHLTLTLLVPVAVALVALTPASAQVQPTASAKAEEKTKAQAKAQAVPQHATATQGLAPLDGNPTIFAVLAAINAAGYDTDIDSPSNSPLRAYLRNFLSKQNIPSLPELRRFVREHHLKDPTEDLGQYISFALLSKGAPSFAPVLEGQRPPDAAKLDGLAPLLAAFYKEANVADLWARSQDAYDAALAQYTDGSAMAMQSVNNYLRNAQGIAMKGRFQVFVDLLGAPNQAHARTYLDEYFVVVTPSAEPRIEEIRHHYLRFWADSLGFKYVGEMQRFRNLQDYGMAAPLLGQAYRDDFVLFTTECFIKAVEARLDHLPAKAEVAKVEQAMREGFVLTPAFFEMLPAFEKQPDTLREYFAEMLKSININKEAKRLDKIDFAKERTVRTVRVTVERPVELTGSAKILQDAEEAFNAKNYDAAQMAWLKLLGSDTDPKVQTRSTYGLARIALTKRDPERADSLFRDVLKQQPDASTLSGTLVYLGKLADSQGEKESAQEFYRKALAVAGLSDQVKHDAEQGLAGAFFRARPPEPADDDDPDEL